MDERDYKAMNEEQATQLNIGGVTGGFDIDKMKTIIPYYIVDMDVINCNELRFIMETFLNQNLDFKNEVDRLRNLI